VRQRAANISCSVCSVSRRHGSCPATERCPWQPPPKHSTSLWIAADSNLRREFSQFHSVFTGCVRPASSSLSRCRTWTKRSRVPPWRRRRPSGHCPRSTRARQMTRPTHIRPARRTLVSTRHIYTSCSRSCACSCSSSSSLFPWVTRLFTISRHTARS